MSSFAEMIVQWQPTGGRNGLVWKTGDPYDVWLSEIMLQQTQVATVLPRFLAFKKRFPTVYDLARSTEEDVLAEWSGLGYYRRAKMLRLCAIELVNYLNTYKSWPQKASEWIAFPGIGRSTAAAITSACFGEKVSILDANAKRVIARFYGLDVASDLWSEAEAQLSSLTSSQMPTYTQGLMDIGAMYCKARTTSCDICPLSSQCLSKNSVIPSKKSTSGNKTILSFHYTMLVKDSRVLLSQRNGESFWPNMWTFPEVQPSGEPVARVKHLLSHRELHLYIYDIDDSGADGTWFDVTDVFNRKISVPSPFVKLLKSL